jgi:hypothetical protein
MVTAAIPEVVIEFERIAPGGDEMWGGTQADFSISRPRHPRRECAVFLNDAGAEYLAGEARRENTTFFRREAARAIGKPLIEGLLRRSGRVDPLIFVARATLLERPDLVDACRDLPPDPPAPEE